MSSYQRPSGSVDKKLEEIPQGTHRVKVIGSIVNITPTSITINDGTGTVNLDLGKVSIQGMEVKKFGRFVANISRSENRLYGNLIAWKEIPKEIITKYWKMVNIERRIHKLKK